MLLVVLDMKTDVNPHSSKCLVRGGKFLQNLSELCWIFRGT